MFKKLSVLLTYVLLITCLDNTLAFASDENIREKLSLDRGWLFHLGDIPFPEIKGHSMTYANAKAGNAGGAAGTEYDDSDWRVLDLPHDWAVEGPFDSDANISQGYRPRGISWYRRYLRIDEKERGRHFELQFDAIATHSTIWVNGNVVSRNWSGYNANYIDITPYIRYGDTMNTIAIQVDANAMEGWWYEGAGIYRHAWLVKTNPVHIITDGVHATPRKPINNKLEGKWQIPIEVTLENSGKVNTNVDVEVSIFDPQNNQVAQQTKSINVPVLSKASIKLPMEVTAPKLWSIEQTNLYRVTTQVRQKGKKIDEVSLNTGFRTINFDAEQGLFLNGSHIKLKGVCIHQDHAGVGVAVPDSIMEYRLRRLKELGVNAIRFSHNAPPAEMLDLVDKMGFLVMDENRNFNPSPDYMKQLQWMVKRDRHHPSIILWSVFNEEPVQGTEVGYEMVRRMTAAVKALDDTRPVTAAMNGGFFTDLNVSHAVDVLGANYQVKDYDRFHKARPEMPFTSSEDTSAFMTRGEFITDTSKNTIASYDENFAQWGNSHRDAWQAIDSRSYMAGGFVWTGFDYRGEPTPNEWPSVSSSFGIMDLNGFAKTAYYIHQVQWIKDRPLIYIAPHWNWLGKEGENIRVMVMANVDQIKLLLNGVELAEQKVNAYKMNYFNVPFQEGKLEAIGFNNEIEVARATVETTGKAVSLELTPDRNSLVGDGRDAMPITVRALDNKGRAVPIDNSTVTFTVNGAGKSIGHGNGDPTSHENEKGNSRQLFNGLAQLIVQSNYESKGEINITANAKGLKSTRISIPVHETPPVPYVAKADAPLNFLTNWRVSPATKFRPDPMQILADNDMNTWGWGQPPMFRTPEENTGANYRLYRTYFTPRKTLADGTGSIHFYGIVGKAEVWLDGKLLTKKDEFALTELNIPLPSGTNKRQLNVIIQGEGNKKAGVFGDVVIEPKK